MQQSSTSWPNYRNQYYNPVSKIRLLIQNLDAELAQLSTKCAVSKSYVLGHTTSGVRYKQDNSASMVAISDPSNSIQTRTISSIYRARVIDAYRNRRIFTVFGNYHTIRRALISRGWLEKLAPGRYPKLQNLPEEVLLQHAKRGNDYEAVAISKIINHFPAFFVWQSKAQRDAYCDVLPHRNRVRRGCRLDFSTKVGLIGCAEQEQWFNEVGVCAMSHPRFYRLGGSLEERMAFIEDFRLTQCRGLLKFILENMNNAGEIIDPVEGQIPISVVHFAVTNVKKHYDEIENRLLDDNNVTNADNETVEWQNFIRDSNDVMRRRAKIKTNVDLLADVAKLSSMYIGKMEEKRPDYRWDGCRNLWILKPGYQCRGIGIVLRNTLDDILQWSSNNPQRRYIAQKYIERPLLIYRTKFDIRAYMLLVIGESVLTIWLFKDCYLRFSSQDYTIDDLRESIHLTNNSVQKKYKNKPNRDVRLPKNNMWSLEQFKIYLKQSNAPNNVWDERIFKGFKENLIAVVMASLEETNFIQNAFELYGCDFMIDEQYQPILIEINSTPDLSPSTEVTARICPVTLKDLVKVVVDLPRNTRAPTGLYEKIYEINYKIKKDFDADVGLDVNGTRMTLYKQQLQRTPTVQTRRAFINKSQTIIKKTGHVIKIPIKKLKKSGTQQQIANPKNGNNSGKSDSCPSERLVKPLKSAAKEALALRYTVPK